mgnify:CR=1
TFPFSLKAAIRLKTRCIGSSIRLIGMSAGNAFEDQMGHERCDSLLISEFDVTSDDDDNMPEEETLGEDGTIPVEKVAPLRR